ncbi:hypothetical protein VNI00_006161 [Paramarasmius palmivorus]|uniref:PUM-HD domain-containing protein n=1 Tax=Paramarasmius palmivorus TaxID=297713 RepID=A0AAW0D7Z9_9AGAR
MSTGTGNNASPPPDKLTSSQILSNNQSSVGNLQGTSTLRTRLRNNAVTRKKYTSNPGHQYTNDLESAPLYQSIESTQSAVVSTEMHNQGSYSIGGGTTSSGDLYFANTNDRNAEDDQVVWRPSIQAQPRHGPEFLSIGTFPARGGILHERISQEVTSSAIHSDSRALNESRSNHSMASSERIPLRQEQNPIHNSSGNPNVSEVIAERPRAFQHAIPPGLACSSYTPQPQPKQFTWNAFTQPQNLARQTYHSPLTQFPSPYNGFFAHTPTPHLNPSASFGHGAPFLHWTPFTNTFTAPTLPTPDTRSPKLVAFHSSQSTDTWALTDIVGHIAEFSCDRYGTRFVQDKLSICSSEQKRVIFSELVPNAALRVMFDAFGNFVIQKLFEQATQAQKIQLALNMSGHIFDLSVDQYGCRVVQKALEHILPDQQLEFLRELEPRIDYCLRHPQAHHVIEKFIAVLQPGDLSFLHVIENCAAELATDHFGCRVIQRCIECIPRRIIPSFFDELHDKTGLLIDDQYGNYVMQCILSHGNQYDKATVIAKIRGQMVRLAHNKYSSNVCEKALTVANPDTRAGLINEFLASAESPNETPVSLLAKDHYGNYVLQRAIAVANTDQREQLLARVREGLPVNRHSRITNQRLLGIERLLDNFNL